MTSSRRGGERPAGASDGKGKGKKKGDASAGKGSSTSKGQPAAKGRGKGKKGEAGRSSSAPQEENFSRALTVQELEGKMLDANGGTTGKDPRREAVKQPLESEGTYCEVKKHSDMGCAVVTFKDQNARQEVMRLAEKQAETSEKGRPTLKVGGVDVQLRPHMDKATQQEVKSDIFFAWGHQAEKTSSLAAETIAKAIDELVHESRGTQPLPHQNGVYPAPLQPFALANALQPQPSLLPPIMTQQPLPPAVVPGPQSPQEYAALAYAAQQLWAQQQQVALQQQQQIAGMQPPIPSPPPMQAPQATQVLQAPQAPPPAQTSVPPETPPRTAGLNRDAAEFNPMTPPPLPLPQANANANVFDPYAYANSGYDAYGYGAESQAGTQRKVLQIVDPKSGEAIEMPQPSPAQPSAGFKATPPRKIFEIVDPENKTAIDRKGVMGFAPPPVTKNCLEIKDPTSGDTIQVK